MKKVVIAITFLLSITAMSQKRVFEPKVFGLNNQSEELSVTVDSLVNTWNQRKGQHNRSKRLIKTMEEILIEKKPKPNDVQSSHNEWRAVSKEVKILNRYEVEITST